ncbi:hypothetical protein [Saccharopolyspora taberi]|uniref:Uncharacterized protein n=1 Tax=Saccharopolyspora taberi TaxID=60895 RepID=A0ABN3VGK6_9PSEU
MHEDAGSARTAPGPGAPAVPAPESPVVLAPVVHSRPDSTEAPSRSRPPKSAARRPPDENATPPSPARLLRPAAGEVRVHGEPLDGLNRLFVTHDLDEAVSMSDEVVLLSAGPASP